MKRTSSHLLSLIAAVCSICVMGQSCSTTGYERTDDGIIVQTGKTADNTRQSIKLQVVNDRIIHVTVVPGDEFPTVKSLMAVEQPAGEKKFMVERGDGHVYLHTSQLIADVTLKTGEVSFKDIEGKPVLAEKQGGGKTFTPVTIQGQSSYVVRQQFETTGDEALYGLGANQTSFMNMKGKDADLFQYNTQAVVPFVISTKNYGILWDNNSHSKFGDIRDYKELSGLKLFNSKGEEGSLSAVYADRTDHSRVFATRDEKEIDYQFIPDLARLPQGYNLQNGFVTWEGAMASEASGLHKFVFTSAGYAKLWVDGKLVVDRWRQCWNACSIRFDLQMEAGRKYPVRIEWIPDGAESYIAMKYLDPIDNAEQQQISFWSEMADQIDYYFIYGQNMDEVISGYRTITGKAPVMPEWALGFWQSRQRYKTQDEILSTVSEFRKRGIPIDNIVLDWQYWPIDKWGDHNFDPKRFPDPDEMIGTLHDVLKANIMISVWPKYYVGTENYEAMNSKGWLYKRNIEKGQKDWIGYISTFYDAFNADARQAFWEQINDKLYKKGIDAWWLDATEPDICSNLPMEERKALMNPTALGPADKVFNAFSLVNAQGVFEGQMKTNPDQRVFILTRSAFAGLQRYSAANWSGDIAARWHDMSAQIRCGLNFSMSGIPFWTMDIGGFSVETRYSNNPGKADVEEWRELMTRWFQFGAFCPIFRSHGEFPNREMYNIAPESHPAYQAMLSADRLRYRLMPYIYSLAGMTWLNDYTIMRGLAMDFPSDPKVFDIGDQYMFGPSLMVNPVCEYKVRSRSVYLPKTCGWYDLFSGCYYNGGQTIEAVAPLSNTPVFVREGSVLPFGPAIQYSAEKPADPVILYVYTGADGSFTLYEDEGINNNYMEGAYSLIPLTYRESDHVLTIGARKGEFMGMPANRTFKIVVVTKGKAQKLDFDTAPDKVIEYSGAEVTVNL